jgi:hypothetical protein
VKDLFEKLLDRNISRTTNVAELLQRVHSACGGEGLLGNIILNGVEYTTKRSWIERYLKRRKEVQAAEAAGLKPPDGPKRGPKPVFPEEVGSCGMCVLVPACPNLILLRCLFSLFCLLPTILHNNQVEEEMQMCMIEFLGGLDVGVDLEYLVGIVKGWIKEKPRWQECVDLYNTNKDREPWECSHEWLRSHMVDWGFAIRKGTTAARKLPPNVEQVHDDYVQRFAFTIGRDLPEDVTMLTPTGERVAVKRIPPELVVNADQTAVAPVSYRNATWARRGCKDVPLMGEGDKRKLTAVLASNAAGEGLPIQVIFEGTTTM